MNYINNLIELKQERIKEDFDKIKDLCNDIAVIRSNKSNILEVLYKQDTFKLSLNIETLDWDIEADMLSFMSKNISTQNLVDKGLEFYFRNLINSYNSYEYGI
jgi:hypothetical protein